MLVESAVLVSHFTFAVHYIESIFQSYIAKNSKINLNFVMNLNLPH